MDVHIFCEFQVVFGNREEWKIESEHEEHETGMTHKIELLANWIVAYIGFVVISDCEQEVKR